MNFIQIFKKHLEKAPYFLILIPLFLIIHIEQEYQYLIPYSFVYSEIIQLLLAPLIIFSISYFLLRDNKKAALYAAIILIIFYFFCDIKDWLHTEHPGLLISTYTFLLPVVAIILLSAYLGIKKSKGSSANVFLFMNCIFFLFIVSDIIPLITAGSTKKNDLGDHSKELYKTYIPCKDCIKPDIYYLIADAFTSSEVLQNEFNYDNRLLDSFFKKNGFFLIPHSKSNYNLTPFSIASCFNLNYLAGLDYSKDFYIKEYLPGVSSVYSSELIPILKKEGYQIINHSTFNINGHPASIKPFDIYDIYSLYQRHNIFKKINTDIGWLIKQTLNIHVPYQDDPEYVKQKDIHFEKTFNALLRTSISPSEQPRFIYGHLVLPHLPSAFDSLGNRIKPASNSSTKKSPKERYIEVVILTRKKLMQIIRSIILNSKRPALIIVQGDHGFRFPDKEKQELEFANLSAMYFYNKDYRLLHDSLSNVNTFRIVLNTFFKKNYPLLKDTSYYLQYK